MRSVIELNIENRSVYFEVEPQHDYQIDKVGVKELGEKVTGSFQQVLDTIRVISLATVEQIRQLDSAVAPDDFELQFGLKLSGEYGVVVAKASAEAQISVTLTYKQNKTESIK